MLYHEITASSLVKVDMQGNIVEHGTTNFAVNVAGFQLHAAIHAARPDIKCVIHIHTPSVLAVSIDVKLITVAIVVYTVQLRLHRFCSSRLLDYPD